jgi:hypothetical protein
MLQGLLIKFHLAKVRERASRPVGLEGRPIELMLAPACHMITPTILDDVLSTTWAFLHQLSCN